MVDEVNSNIQLISRFEYNKVSKHDNSHSWGSLEFIFFLGLEVPQTCLLLTPRCSLNLHFPSLKMMRKHFSLARNGKSKHRFECFVILPVCFAGHEGTHGTYKTSWESVRHPHPLAKTMFHVLYTVFFHHPERLHVLASFVGRFGTIWLSFVK